MTSDETGINRSPGTLVWYPCSDRNGLAEMFGVPGFRGYLPFLLDENDTTTEPEERHLLLGILYGWPQLRDDKAMGVPNDRDQNEILEILLTRLMRGYGWTKESEMSRDLGPYILAFFDPYVTADILEFLMMREANPDPFVTWCSLMWDIWLRDREGDILNRPFNLVLNLDPDGFSGVSWEWIRLIANAVYRYKGNEDCVEDWIREIPLEDELSSGEIRTKYRILAALDAVKQEDLVSLGPAPAGLSDRLVLDLQDLYQFNETFPDFEPLRVTADLAPQRHMLSYTYHPKAVTAHEAFGLEADDLKKFLEDLVNMAVDYHNGNPGGAFLRVDAAHRLLRERKDGGGILMALAWQRVEELVGKSISKALAGTLFEDRDQ